MTGPELLKKQLELVRFEKAIDYIASNARTQKHLNGTELAYINGLIAGRQNEEAWRQDSTVIQLPSGQTQKIEMISNPIFAVRDIISEAQLKAQNGELVDAATHLYSQLVLHHFFKDANRRTAVAATYWLLLEKGEAIRPMGLLEVGLGDLRDKAQLETLKALIRATIHVTKK